MSLGVCFVSVVVVSFFVGGQGEVCRDGRHNCEAYDKDDICKSGLYPEWVKRNCQAYCGLCTRTEPCKDAIDDCDDYDLEEACFDKYKNWAQANCEKSCGYCTEPPAVPTKPPTNAPVNPTKPVKPANPVLSGATANPVLSGATQRVSTGTTPDPGMSMEDQGLILEIVNELRSQVQPPAKSMPKVIWDDNLATLARTWTQACTYGSVDYVYASSKLASSGFANWNETFQVWSASATVFQYGKNLEDYLKTLEERYALQKYAQLVDSDMVRMGCSSAHCQQTQIFVCNFVKGKHNYNKNIQPYETGPQCESCPRSCTNGLCDCDGLLCYGKTNLNHDSCTCEEA